MDKTIEEIKEMTQELYQAVIGIPENPDANGLIGDMEDVKELLKAQNGHITKNTVSISRLKGGFLGLSVFISLAGLILVALKVLG